MGRILAIDYGKKRCGIAVTDPLQMIANGLDTVATTNLLAWLSDYFRAETVEAVVVGEPLRMNDTPSEVEADIRVFLKALAKQFPTVSVYRQDERFTSRMAAEALVLGGAKKKQRQRKELVDKVSAALILQSFLEQRGTP